jgi:hypothetical protein
MCDDKRKRERRERRACYRVGKGGGIVALKLGLSEWQAK